MAPARQTLFQLFGDPTSRWPAQVVEHDRLPRSRQRDPEPAAWLAALNNSVRVSEVRGGAREDRVAVEAALSVDPGTGFLSYPDGWPFVIASMPDVEFRIQPFPDTGLAVRMFASAGDSGFELVLEGLPVEIRLPAGLVQPHPDAAGGPDGELVIERGEFRAGRLDDLRVVYRRIDPTSIFVHVRILMSEAYEFHIQPVVPISFERCGLSGIPCTAIHDFRLIASPELAPDHFEWLRHPVDPIVPSHTATHDGLFSVRSVDIDETADGVADVVQWLNGHATDKDPTAELVLGDLVVPFQGPLLLPVPRHLTAGLRRKVLDPASIGQVFAFERAPVHIHLADDLAFIVESLFYRSQPAHELPAEPEPKPDPGGDPDALGLTFSAALVWGEDESPQQGLEIGLDEDYTIVTGYKRGFSTSDGLPDTGTGAQRVLNGLLHWEIAGTVLLDVMSVRAGLSLGRKFVQGQSFSDSTLLTCDLFVSMPSTGDDDAWFRLRTLRGEKVAFAMEGLGWRLGGLHLEGLALPDGVVAHFGSVAFIIRSSGSAPRRARATCRSPVACRRSSATASRPRSRSSGCASGSPVTTRARSSSSTASSCARTTRTRSTSRRAATTARRRPATRGCASSASPGRSPSSTASATTRSASTSSPATCARPPTASTTSWCRRSCAATSGRSAASS